jgi:hypothetical protein
MCLTVQPPAVGCAQIPWRPSDVATFARMWVISTRPAFLANAATTQVFSSDKARGDKRNFYKFRYLGAGILANSATERAGASHNSGA